jgi:hypothetical protein
MVVTRLRNGTTVTANAPRLAAASLRDRAAQAAQEYVATLSALGLSIEDAVAAVRRLEAPRQAQSGGSPDRRG